MRHRQPNDQRNRTAGAFDAGRRLLYVALAFGSLSFPATVSADTPFSPQAIFALPDHNYIDDRCLSAKTFADHASHEIDDVDRDGALAGANVFFKCYSLPRLNADENAQRYLYLATATSLYLAATKSSGVDAANLLRWTQSMARALGAIGPDHTVVIEHVVQGSRPNSIDNPVPVNPTHEYYVIDRSPFGVAHAGKFTPEANALLEAVGAQAARLAAAAPASPASPLPLPSPSRTSAPPGTAK